MTKTDKIYGTRKQYKELYSWCKERRKAIEEICKHDPLKCFYDIDYQNTDVVVVADFPLSIDFYLLQHCSIEWVQKAIKYKRKIEDKK